MELVYKEDTKENVKKGQSTKTKTYQIANIKCMYTNADTLTNKMPELKALVRHTTISYSNNRSYTKKLPISSPEGRNKNLRGLQYFPGVYIKHGKGNYNSDT